MKTKDCFPLTTLANVGSRRKHPRMMLHRIMLVLFALSLLIPTYSGFAQEIDDEPNPLALSGDTGQEITEEPLPTSPSDPLELEQLLVEIRTAEQMAVRQSLGMVNQVYLPSLRTAPPAPKTPSGYFVATNGSDNAAGTFDKPWRTINYAVSRLKPGETLYVRSGVYHEAVNIRNSGTQSAPVRVKGYTGETAVIEGSFNLPQNNSGLLSIYGSWVEVYNLEVRNANYVGVGIYGEHNLVDGLFVHHSKKSGISANGDYSIVQNCKAWRNSILNENSASPNSYSTGITAARDSEDGLTENAIIRNNHAWENWGQGISTYEAKGTIITGNVVHDSYSTNIYISDAVGILVKGNFVFMDPSSYIYGHGANVGIMMGDERYDPPSSYVYIINNVAFGNKRNLFWWKGERGFMNNVLIANNTFVNSTYGAGVMLNEGSHVNVRFYNNLVMQENSVPPIALNANQDIRFANNVWSSPPQKYAVGPSDHVGNPGLRKIGSIYSYDWYRLTATSPAIDRGIVLPEVDVDYFYVKRAPIPDIGAVEYVP